MRRFALFAVAFALAYPAAAIADELHLDPVDDTVTVTVQQIDGGKRLVFDGGHIDLTQARADTLAEQLHSAAPPPPPADSDGDGVPDADDKCPAEKGSQPDGCNPPPPAPKCSNGLDDDADGLIDLADPGCANAQADDESNVIVDPPPPPPDPEPSGDCDATVSSVNAAQSSVSIAAPGDVICLADGTYGAISLNATKSGKVTLTAAHPGKAFVGKVTIKGSNLALTHLIASSLQVSAGSSSIDVDSNSFKSSGLVVFLYGDSGVISNVSIANNEISGTGDAATGENDAIRLHNFKDVTIEHNRITNISGKNGGHNDNLQTVHGGSGLTLRYNRIGPFQYRSQGFFVKDGAVSNYTVEDNLITGDTSGDAYPLSFYDVTNATIRRNTIWDDPGSVGARGSANRNVTLDSNVFQTKFQCESGSQCTLTNNVQGGSPQFVNRAGGDYRLVGGAAGITWDATAQHYGP